MIRDAIPDDVPALVELGRRMATESPHYAHLPYSPAKMDRLFRSLIDSADGLLVLAEVDGAVVGVMAAMVAEHWMSEARIATDFGVYVVAKHRGYGALAARMIKRFRAWAHERGSVQTTLGISTEVCVEQTARFYTLLGLRQFGLLFEVPRNV